MIGTYKALEDFSAKSCWLLKIYEIHAILIFGNIRANIIMRKYFEIIFLGIFLRLLWNGTIYSDAVTGACNERSLNNECIEKKKKHNFLIPFAIQLTVQISVSRKLERFIRS